MKPKASPPKPPKPEPQPQEYTKDEHIRIIRSTLDQLTQALSDVLIATPDKVGPISREIRAMTAELERLTTEEETEVKEESALDHFFTNNVVGFPGTQAG
ncbi:hypothetical protein VVR12_01760 [Rothia sp. LK2588]|uniref:hypothetical protein n=1 Tax=Rothia sp. LK2588 TaxID=3114369 RepID=UPI0034CFD1A9